MQPKALGVDYTEQGQKVGELHLVLVELTLYKSEDQAGFSRPHIAKQNQLSLLLSGSISEHRLLGPPQSMHSSKASEREVENLLTNSNVLQT